VLPALRCAGVALGFALKLFPGLLGLAIVFRGERHAMRAMISTALVAVLLPWVAVAMFLRGPLGVRRGGPWPEHRRPQLVAAIGSVKASRSRWSELFDSAQLDARYQFRTLPFAGRPGLWPA
jgi:Glycosyltransferase family 87